MTNHKPIRKAFRQFQYLTPPLSVSDEFRNRLVERSLERFGDLWEVR